MFTRLIILTVIFANVSAFGGDWPQFLGPTRDAVYAGPSLADDWGKDGPRVVWKKAVGEGYSSPVVAAGKVVQCHRVGDELIVQCFDAATGSEVWKFSAGTTFKDGAYFDNGPRATPAIKGGRVFVHGTDGFLVALDGSSGKSLWSVNTKEQFGNVGTWSGTTGSPLVTDQAVFLNVGSTNDAGVVAFDPATGKVLWQATKDKATCSSPVLATVEGRPELLVLTRSALRALDPATGREFWHWRTGKQTSGNVYAATPAVRGGQVFVSGWYQLGAALLDVTDGMVTKAWASDDVLSAHYTLPIVQGDFVYGYHGHAWEREHGGPNLRCIELATGKMKWEQPKDGSGTIIRSGGDLLILTEGGELRLAAASPNGFKLKARAQVLSRTVRSYPAVADGFVFLKGPRQLVCLDLRRP